MSGGILRTAIVAAVAIVSVSACSATVSGEASPDPSAVPKLDTGNYRTSPREVPQPPAEEAKVQGSWAVADALVSPAEVDPALQYLDDHDAGIVALGSGIIDDASKRLLFSPELGNAIPTDSLAGGFSTTRRSEKGVFTGTGRGLFIAVVRMLNEDAAATAMTNLRQARTSQLASLDGLPGLPDALALDSRFAGPRAGKATWVVRSKGDLIFANHYGAAVSEADAKSLAAKAISAQQPRAAAMSLSAQQLISRPPDQDSIMSLTLERARPAGDVIQVQRTNGYQTARAYLMHSGFDWDVTRKLIIDDAGIDLVGVSQSQVLRARDAVGAELAARAWSKSETPTDPVPGVANSRCYKSVDTTANSRNAQTYTFACTVWRGRYLAQVSASSSEQAAWQQAAAQYLILGQAK